MSSLLRSWSMPWWRSTSELLIVAIMITMTTRSTAGAATGQGSGIHHPVPLPTEWTTPLQVGDRVPTANFVTRTRLSNEEAEAAGIVDNPFIWKVRSTADYFAGKRIVLFALPGAFTPTCSTTHLPGYQAMYDRLLELGVDDVYCLSVNDAFVMRQWGLSSGLEEDFTADNIGTFTKVKLIPDGTAAFTRGMGMSTLWTSERGFGERSWRYSMVVNDGVIEAIFVEQPKVQDSGPDPFEVSDADTMVSYLESNLPEEAESHDEL